MPVNDILAHSKLARLQQRFAVRYVAGKPNACWNWTRSLSDHGYGRIIFDGEMHYAHRVAWVLTNGPIPASGLARPLSVCHTCDNRRCVNPRHMFLGTDSDNILDCTRKGRLQQGAAHWRAKLVAEQVMAIRKDPRPSRVVARDYGVSGSTICYIRKRGGGAWPSLGAY